MGRKDRRWDDRKDEKMERDEPMSTQAEDGLSEEEQEDLKALLDMVFSPDIDDGLLLDGSTEAPDQEPLSAYDDLWNRFTRMEEEQERRDAEQKNASVSPEDREDTEEPVEGRVELIELGDPKRANDPNGSQAMFERIYAEGRHEDFDGNYLRRIMSGRKCSIYAYTVADRAYVCNSDAWRCAPTSPAYDIHEAIEYYDTPDVFWMVARHLAIGAIYIPKRDEVRIAVDPDSSAYGNLCESLSQGQAVGTVIGELWDNSRSEDDIEVLYDDMEAATALDADDPIWGCLDYVAIVLVNEPRPEYADRWEELGLPVYQMMDDREKCLLVLDRDAEEFDRQRAAYVADGGTEGTFCYACQWRAETLGLDVVRDWIRNGRMAEETRRFAAEEGWEA